MSWKVVAAVLLSNYLTYASGVSIESLDEQLFSNNLTVARIRVNNETPFTLENVSLEYYVHKEGNKEIVAEPYYVPGASISIVDIDDSSSIIKIAVDSIPSGVFPNSSGICVGIRNSDWSSRNKNLDFSNPDASSFHSAENIALYIDGAIIYGNTPNAFLESPDAHTGVLYSGITIMQDEGDSVPFSWQPVPGYANYQLSIYNEDSSLVYRKNYTGLSARVALSPGRYLWGVRGVLESEQPSSSPRKLSIMNIVRKALIKEKEILGIPSLYSQKDTKLLVTSWGEFADLRGWDQKHDTSHLDESYGKCWAIAIQELNHFYGGDLPLDEIVAWSHINVDDRNKKRGPSLSAFMLGDEQGGIDTLEIEFGLRWALGITPVWVRDIPSKDVIRSAIQNHKPIYFNVKPTKTSTQHSMVMDGYALTQTDEFFVHFLNIDNYGNNIWTKYDESEFDIDGEQYSVSSYTIIDSPQNVKKTDSLVFKDSDGDGLMDFDELYRFFTDPNEPDSDGDDVYDKTEIYSYTIRQRAQLNPKTYLLYKGEQDALMIDSVRAGLNFFIAGIRTEPLADVDGDSSRAELDADSDEDGFLDGEEDVNNNGLVDEGETDPYKYEGSISAEIIPKELAIYSFDYIWLNDGVMCSNGVNTKTGCNIAAEGKQGFTVILGAMASVREIHSSGQVWLRSNANVEQTIRYYGLPERNFVTKKQNGASLRHEYNSDARLWPWNINVGFSDYTSFVGNIVVQNGQSVRLHDGDSIETLKVESGGLLTLPIGRIIVNNLQLESGSMIRFEYPGYETTLQVNNKAIWRTEIVQNVALDSIARGFRLAYYGNETVNVEGEWAGLLFAPRAKVVLAQTKYKNIYGQIVGRGVSIHQYAKVFKVSYNPKTLEIVTIRTRQ